MMIPTHILEAPALSNGQPKHIGWAAFAQPPAGTLNIAGTMWQILGYRWATNIDTAEVPTGGELPAAIIEIMVHEPGRPPVWATMQTAPPSMVEGLKLGGRLNGR